MTTPFITLTDTELLRARTRISLAKKIQEQVGFVLKLVLVVVGVYLIVSGPAQLARLNYWWDQWLGVPVSNHFSPSQFLGHNPDNIGIQAPDIGEGHLVIPSIGVDAPILWDIPLADSLNGLQRGVVHAQESTDPGQVGRTFIIGHSSGYWWNDNPWTKVFALLDKVKANDFVFLKREGKIFAYKINSQEVVSPKQVEVLRDDELRGNELALMTCTPVGTNLNRLIVYADPVRVAN